MNTNTNLIPATLALAGLRVGVKEVPRGSNKGPEVNKYLRRVGIAPGSPWCAAFTADTIATIAATAGVTCPVPLTASCDVLLEWARKRGRLFASAQPGDLFLVMASEHDAVHTGFVEAVHTAAGTLTTVEGNSNSSGGREGFEVVRRTRGLRSLRFVRWQYGPASDLPAEGATLPVQASKPPARVTTPAPWTLYVGGSSVAGAKNLGSVPIILDAAQVPIRRLARALGFEDKRLAFDPTAQGVVFDGKLLPAQVTLIKGEAFGAARKVAAGFGLDVTADNEGKTVWLHRPAA